MYLSEHLEEKWGDILNHGDLPEIKDPHKRAVTAIMLENQQKALSEDRTMLTEAAPANNSFASAGIDRYDPILIGLVRRAMPQLMAYDICGVQPMSGPTGLIFAMRSTYGAERGNAMTRVEALYNEADTDFSSSGFDANYAGTVKNGTHAGTNPVSGTYTTGQGMTTAEGEALGDSSSNAFGSMSFAIDKTSVTARSRALKAEYTLELAQDLKAVHGLDAESELANILSQEIMFEINREIVRIIYKVAKQGSPATNTPGEFNLDIDSNGRWSVERFKGLLFNIERDANHIAQDTRRGKGNFLVCSADVASALAMAGVLDYAPALQGNNSLNVDDTGNTFAGILNGRYRVYVDPYSANLGAASQFYMVGYKGTSPYDAGLFYCPYVPLQMVRAVDPNNFQPKIGFKTRYGLVANPYVVQSSGLADQETMTAQRNQYYRMTKVSNLM
jgi:hypothetical protein